MNKTYVQVDNYRSESGEILPVTVAWKDGRVLNIDRVIHSCVSFDGEYEGTRYTVIAGGEERYIYRIGHIWYVTE